MSLISAKGLIKRYRKREVVKGIDLDIRQGEVVAIIGPNGAGKSTTLSMLLGILTPDEGTVAYWRKDYRSRIGVQLQATPFFEGYTAEENMRLFAALYEVSLNEEQLEEKLQACGLLEVRHTPAVRLSIGQQKRLAIALTTVHQPDLIVLDEPTAGLDPRSRRDIRNAIIDLAASGKSIIFSSHDMDEVERMADRVVILASGRIVAQGKPDELLARYDSDELESLYFKMTENA